MVLQALVKDVDDVDAIKVFMLLRLLACNSELFRLRLEELLVILLEGFDGVVVGAACFRFKASL